MWASRESGRGEKWKKKMKQQKRWLTGGCGVSQASNMSLIEADA